MLNLLNTKLLIAILVAVLALSSGIGYYAYTVHQQQLAQEQAKIAEQKAFQAMVEKTKKNIDDMKVVMHDEPLPIPTFE